MLVAFPRPPKHGQPAGVATSPAQGANVTIMQGNRTVASGRADNTGYYGARLQPGRYSILIAHGNIRHRASISISNQRVRQEITIQSNSSYVPTERRAGGAQQLRGRYEILQGGTRSTGYRGPGRRVE